ncbi:hypothetical protein TFLX_04795 [Thermoflexales bacterium]|nr:hypothetical protein TFLX_04795 [Thermoflexales bacterium]
MKQWPIFWRWLTVAALLEWLIGRTLTRSAIFMPKTPFMISSYQVLGTVGQVAITMTSLLALISILWIAWQERRNITFALLLITSVACSLTFIFVLPDGWWPVIDRMLLVAISTVLLGRLWRAAGDRRRQLILTIPVLAVWLGALYHWLPALAQALQLPEVPALGRTLFNIGEILVAFTPIGLWLLLRPRERIRVYALATIPAILFSIMHLIAPALVSMLVIWSIGLTLYLPWPLYALSLWLGMLAISSALKRDEAIGWGLLLLLAAGYAPQVSTHVFISLSALWLMLAGQPVEQTKCTSSFQSQPQIHAVT